MKKVRNFFIDRNIPVDKVGFFEDLLFEHHFNDDIEMWERGDVRPEAIMLLGLLVITALAIIAF